MKKVVTEEQKAKLRQGLEEFQAERKERAEKAITFGKYKVYKLDEHNVVIAEEGKEYLYYPELAHALKGLLHKELSSSDARDIKALLAETARIEKAIFSSFSLSCKASPGL